MDTDTPQRKHNYNFLNAHIQNLTLGEHQGGSRKPTIFETVNEKKIQKERNNTDETAAAEANKQKNGKPKTILEQILIGQSGVVSEYFAENKDFEAYGILQNLYQLGPFVCRLRLQIEYYEILMKTDRGEEAHKLVDEILGVLKQRLRVDTKTCKRLAQRYFDDKKYFKSILFDLLGNHMLPDVKDAEKMLSGIARNMIRLQKSIKKACKESYSHKKTLRVWVLPRVRTSLQLVFSNARGKSKKVLTLLEVACKHKLEIAEGYVDDYDAVETTLLEAKELLINVLGEEAEKMHLLGTLLNNLGANYLMQKRPLEAKECLARAIHVNMTAADYDSQEEKESDITRSNRALSRAEDMLKHQNS